PPARLTVTVVRIGLAARESPGEAGVQTQAGVLPVQTESDAAALFAAGFHLGSGLSIDADLAMIVEEIGRVASDRVTQLDLAEQAFIAEGFAGGVRAYAASAAQAEGLGGVQVVAGPLRRDPAVQPEAGRQVLQPDQLHVDFVEAPVAAGGGAVQLAHVAVEVELACRPGDGAEKQA